METSAVKEGDYLFPCVLSFPSCTLALYTGLPFEKEPGFLSSFLVTFPAVQEKYE